MVLGAQTRCGIPSRRFPGYAAPSVGVRRVARGPRGNPHGLLRCLPATGRLDRHPPPHSRAPPRSHSPPPPIIPPKNPEAITPIPQPSPLPPPLLAQPHTPV